MSFDAAIRIAGLDKTFPIYEKPHHRLFQMLSPKAHKARWFREFHALSNINLTIGRGETVGIVGRNGSGKSTLLQIICGTLMPTHGDVQVHGRVAALLELGSGFNPDFTGRENVYLNGTLLGLSKEQIDERFDDIATFADIGEFIEQPVKSYSSGMYVRLAFAVAINVTPDILIIDEALSVGDEAFQRKCFARIEKIRDGGATILFVSHSAGTVVDLCNKAVLLDRGELLASGAPKFVVSRYQKLIYAPADRVQALRSEIRSETLGHVGNEDVEVSINSEHIDEVAPEAYLDDGLVPQSTVTYVSRGARIKNVRIETLEGEGVNVLVPGEEYVYAYSVTFDSAAASVRFGMLIKTISGVELGGGASAPTSFDAHDYIEQGTNIDVKFRFTCLLAPGTYFLNAGVVGDVGEGETFLDRLIDVSMFRVQHDPLRLATGLVDFGIKCAYTNRDDFGASE